jgi:tetratricopeptide (TPR) repeat protein
MYAMNFRRNLVIIAAILLAALLVQPALSADNLTSLSTGDITSVVTNHTAENVTKTIVVNQTSDLEKDAATSYFNSAQRMLAACAPQDTCDYTNIIQIYDQALALNTTMLKKTDGIQYLYQGKAFAQIQLEKYTDAIATTDAGLALYPKDAILWNNKGFALQNLKRDQEALAAYDKAVSLDGNYTNALLNQANLLNQIGKYPEAAAAFTRANETDPFNINASDGLEAARKGESAASQTMTIIMVIVLVAAVGIVIWYVKFRKPDEPAPEEKKKKSRKK